MQNPNVAIGARYVSIRLFITIEPVIVLFWMEQSDVQVSVRYVLKFVQVMETKRYKLCGGPFVRNLLNCRLIQSFYNAKSAIFDVLLSWFSIY